MNRLVRILKSKILILAVSSVLVYTIVGFFLLPYLVQHYVPGIVQGNFKKSGSIGEVRFNPYVFTFDAKDFSINELDGQPIIGFKRLFVDLELKSLFKLTWIFKQISVEQPHLNTIINRDGTLNLAGLVPESKASSPKKKKASLPLLILEHLAIDQGRIDFTDKRQSKPASVYLMPLNLDMKNLTTLPGQKGSQTITASTGDGATFRWTGNISLNPVATSGTLKLENIQTKTLWEFVRDSVTLEAPAGKITVTADLNFDLGGAVPKLTLDNLACALTGLILKLTGAELPFLELPDTKIVAPKLDITGQNIEISRVVLTGGAARVVVDKSGVVNLGLIAKAPGQPSSAITKPPATKDAGTKPWKINVSAFNLAGFYLDFQDKSRVPGLKAGIDKIKMDLAVEALTGGAGTRVLINHIAADLSGLVAKLGDKPEPEVWIHKVLLDGGSYDLSANTFTMEKIAVTKGKVDLKREKDGAINLALLAGPPRKSKEPDKPGKIEKSDKPFQFLAKTISLSGLETVFSDLSVKPDGPIINLEEINVVLNNVDGKSPMAFNLGLRVRGGGQVKAEGTINPALPSVESEIQVSDFHLTPFQPYLDQAVFLKMTSGALSTRGALKYGIKEAKAQTLFQGSLKLENIRFLEPGNAKTFLGWKALGTDQLKLQLQPDGLEIGELKLAELVGRFIIYQDRTLNITKVIKKDTRSKTVSSALPHGKASAVDPFPVSVRRLTLREGKVEFADLSLTPQFGTMIHELKGFVAGISTKKASRAQVNLNGRVDEYGTAKIDGELNTLDPKTFTNIDMVFRNVEMARLTPYSGRFAGRTIDSGKLSMDLEYDIQNSKLLGHNKIVVERLVLGKRVESPDAVNLPLDLAIALLEDSKGVINIGLPVTGDLDSPEFSYQALIWKAFTSLIAKMVTSPFRMLGALLPGGGEETLNIVAFEPGMFTIPPPEKEKLFKFAAVLEKRPKLKLIVQGRYNPESDLVKLRSASLRNKLALRQGQKLEPDVDPGPVDYGNPDIIEVLETMFVESFGPDKLKIINQELKTKAGKGKQDKGKTEDPGELGKILFSRLVDVEPVKNAELVRLADNRSQTIMEELMKPGGLPKERMEIKSSTAMTGKDQPTALLNLEVVK